MPRRVLIVDDEHEIRNVLKLSFIQAGYETTTAVNGREALDKVAQEPPDLIVLDVMMPGMSGLQVLQQLKESEATKRIPIIILSAANEYEDLEKGWEKGTDVYLTKPLNPTQLIEYVQSILED